MAEKKPADRKPIWVSLDIHRDLKMQAANESVTMGELIRRMLIDRQKGNASQEFRATAA